MLESFTLELRMVMQPQAKIMKQLIKSSLSRMAKLKAK